MHSDNICNSTSTKHLSNWWKKKQYRNLHAKSCCHVHFHCSQSRNSVSAQPDWVVLRIFSVQHRWPFHIGELLLFIAIKIETENNYNWASWYCTSNNSDNHNQFSMIITGQAGHLKTFPRKPITIAGMSVLYRLDAQLDAKPAESKQWRVNPQSACNSLVQHTVFIQIYHYLMHIIFISRQYAYAYTLILLWQICPSICESGTHWDCIKTNAHTVKFFLPSNRGHD